MVPKKNAFFKTGSALMIAVMMLFSAALAYADNAELKEIRHAIQAKGAKWHADETSVSNLTWKEKKKYLGGSEFEDLLVEFYSDGEMAPLPEVEGAPYLLDWRNLGGISYVSPVKNQGGCGSCWAFATTAGVESQVMLSKNGTPIDLSEQVLVSCSGAGTCSGGSSASASNYIRDWGLPLESCFAYTATNNLCINACADYKTNTYRINGWHKAYTTSVNAAELKNAIYSYGPVIATMYVYNDFFSYKSGVYSYTTGAYAGAHAVLAVGYDDTLQAFIVKNSWGSGWGEAGFFKIAYSEVAGTSKFGYSTMVYDGYGADPIPEPDPDPAPDPSPTPCTYSLSSSGATFKATGGTGAFTLYSSGSCSLVSLSAVSSAPWVTITSTSTGSSSVAVSYSVAANTGAARTATISIAGLSHTVTQQKVLTNSGKKK
jgi:C1A family cysteine protease